MRPSLHKIYVREMNMKINLCVLFCALLISCGSKNRGSEGEFEAIFDDSAVTLFEQVHEEKLSYNLLQNMLFPSVHAVSGNVKCTRGSRASFKLVAFNWNVDVTSTCDESYDLTIRKALLSSLQGKAIIAEIGGCPGCNILSQGRVLTFRSGNNFWGSYDNVEAGSVAGCKDKYHFSESDGVLTIENDPSHYSGTATNQDCLDAEFPGATADDYKKELKFRFKNGKMELDPNGIDFEDNGDYNRWCIKASNGNSCL